MADTMRITYRGGFDITTRWRWDIYGEFGFAMTRRGAASAARQALAQRRREQGGNPR